MRVSLKSWHYRLVKYILGNSAPTPKTMQNGCPYFWLLIFSMFALPFKLIGLAIWNIVKFIPDMTFKLMEYMTKNWLNEISDEDLYSIWYYNYNSDRKIPLTTKFLLKIKIIIYLTIIC